MKKITLWAFQHPVVARTLMVILQIILIILMIELAGLLFEYGIQIPFWLFWLTSFLLAVDFLIFYSGKRKWKRMINGKYLIRKANEAFVGAGFAMLVLIFFNRNLAAAGVNAPAWASAFVQETGMTPGNPRLASIRLASIPLQPINTNVAATTATTDVSSTTPSATGISKKELRKQLRSQLKELRKELRQSDEKDKGWKIFLVIFVGVILVAGLAVLSCTIACNGAEAAAILLFLGGTTLIVFAITRWVQKIKGTGRFKKINPPAEPKPDPAIS